MAYHLEDKHVLGLVEDAQDRVPFVFQAHTTLFRWHFDELMIIHWVLLQPGRNCLKQRFII